MEKVPPKSSKWVGMNRDLRLAQNVVEGSQLPSMDVETLTLTRNGDAFAPMTKANSNRSGATTSTSRRLSSLVAAATKTRS